FAEGLAEPISDWKRARISFKEHVAETFEKTQAEAKQAFNAAKTAFGSGLSAGSENGGEGSKYAGPEAVEARASQLHERLGNLHEKQVQRLEERFREDVAESKSALEKRIAGVGGNQTEEEIAADLERQFENLVSQWKEAVPPVHRRLLEDQYDASLTELLGSQVDKWEPPSSFEGSLPFGVLRFAADPDTLPGPESESLALDGPAKYDIPLRLRVPDAASVFVESKSSGREASIELLNFLSLGWLVSSPAGRLSFSFFDPVGLGESFAGLMHLSDYEEILINSRIRTREDQIEARLGELCEHMEKVIQMYLRNDYETITEYNEAAGTIAERYHFVVIADFPNGFSDLALQRLQSIATSGARCGVFLLAHVDTGAEMPRTAQLPELQRNAIRLIHREGAFHLPGIPEEGAVLSIERLPEGADFGKWVHRIGEANRDSNRIEVPFSFIAPEPEQRWTGSTKDEISVPIGRSGATKLQYLSLGKGTCQHALIAGKTGSGKSTLFHVIVTNLALWCDPDEVEFYLIDFNKGVVFKCYADQDLPHARVIAIESDREFGLSVLQRLDRELRERGELFRAAGVQDVPGYRSLEDGKKLPRTLLLIDEFQEFFIEDDSIAQQAAVLLDRIVRQGRAFGIHAVLGSQTLGGAFTLARATLGQMTVRVALACNEADAYLIMDDSNPAPRLLTRPGEGIYNDRAGAMEANSPFQVVWMEEDERDELLDGVSTLALEQEKGAGERVIFEGNAPGEIAKDGTAAEILKQGETP
ncbi:MAG: FtsK/SpoIIIE domain-containing protein, partial [Verrucomicrobiota bacterium]